MKILKFLVLNFAFLSIVTINAMITYDIDFSTFDDGVYSNINKDISSEILDTFKRRLVPSFELTYCAPFRYDDLKSFYDSFKSNKLCLVKKIDDDHFRFADFSAKKDNGQLKFIELILTKEELGLFLADEFINKNDFYVQFPNSRYENGEPTLKPQPINPFDNPAPSPSKEVKKCDVFPTITKGDFKFGDELLRKLQSWNDKIDSSVKNEINVLYNSTSGVPDIPCDWKNYTKSRPQADNISHQALKPFFKLAKKGFLLVKNIDCENGLVELIGVQPQKEVGPDQYINIDPELVQDINEWEICISVHSVFSCKQVDVIFREALPSAESLADIFYSGSLIDNGLQGLEGKKANNPGSSISFYNKNESTIKIAGITAVAAISTYIVYKIYNWYKNKKKKKVAKDKKDNEKSESEEKDSSQNIISHEIGEDLQ